MEMSAIWKWDGRPCHSSDFMNMSIINRRVDEVLMCMRHTVRGGSCCSSVPMAMTNIVGGFPGDMVDM